MTTYRSVAYLTTAQRARFDFVEAQARETVEAIVGDTAAFVAGADIQEVASDHVAATIAIENLHDWAGMFTERVLAMLTELGYKDVIL